MCLQGERGAELETRKTCKRCNIEKLKTEEYFRLRRKYSKKYKKVDYVTYFNSWCRECEIEYGRERNKVYYENNKQKIIDNVNEWRKTNKDKTRKYNIKSNKKNAKSLNEYRVRYRSENIEKVREAERKLREKNRGRYASYAQKRRTLAKNAPCNLTEKEWNEILIKFNKECAYCGADQNITRDHFVPLSRGGGYTKENMIPACGSCNSSKRDVSFARWYMAQSFYCNQRERKILNHIHQKGSANQ